jgi:hypothetical protein
MSVRSVFVMLLIGLTAFVVVSAAAFFMLSNFGQTLLGTHDNARAEIHYALVAGLLATPVVLIWWRQPRRGPVSKDRR